MHIIYEKTGGFAGITISKSFNLEDLPQKDAWRIKTLIDQIDFSALPSNFDKADGIPDQYNYSITVETEEWTHTIAASDSSAPSEVQPLIEILNTLSRKQSSAGG
jgi:hypothetical protein